MSSQWLATQGYSRQLLAQYASRGWLERVARGAFRRPGPPLKWQQVVYSLQHMGTNLHLGGLTALSLLGRAHQIPLSGRVVLHLYGADELPPWAGTLLPNVAFEVHRTDLFGEGQGAPSHCTDYLWGTWDWKLRMSTMERAWLEMLDGVPHQTGFDEADEMATGLQSLRPAAMNTLLQKCDSFKVRRLALWLGERHGQAWRTRLKDDALDLGHGKRSLAPGGRLVSRYRITVPAHLADAA